MPGSRAGASDCLISVAVDEARMRVEVAVEDGIVLFGVGEYLYWLFFDENVFRREQAFTIQQSACGA